MRIIVNRTVKERKDKMQVKMKLIVVSILIALLAAPVWAQGQSADNMHILLDKIRADKKLLVAANMDLTEAEAKTFWPLYDQYQNELFLLRGHTAGLINDYSKSYGAMSDDKAKALLDEFVNIQDLSVKLLQAYLPKFREILPAKKVARYYQIENKIQAVLYYELAREIPLVH